MNKTKEDLSMIPSLGRPIRSQNMGKMMDIDLSPYKNESKNENDSVQRNV